MTQLICICNKVTTKDVKKILSHHPHADLEDIIRITSAASSCGRCKGELTAYVEKTKQEISQKDNTGQLTLPFDFS
ncbi:(2Fe-2S)-binding protein [Thermophagus sp. OGC60D27]|uniref:(2Fe-2S)-binding protein n=1 Tax=Thermophagus sp. OGC60D27 TaxID=3458415 RepID=UPI004038336E